MRQLKNYVFLTGSEILIRNSYQLTVHLPKDDTRLDAIMKNKDKELFFVVYEPLVKWYGTFLKSRWYLIPRPISTGKVISKNYVHLSFDWRYKYKNSNPSRELTTAEIDFFRQNNYLNEN